MERVALYAPSYRNAAFTQNGIAEFNGLCSFQLYSATRSKGVRLSDKWDLRPLCSKLGYRVIQIRLPESEVPLDKMILEKLETQCISLSKQSSSLILLSEDIGNSSMKASSYGLKNLKYVAEHLSEWTSDVTNRFMRI
jgi:hypothetical protein